MGDDYERPARDEEIARMAALVELSKPRPATAAST
jgi:hypothetical protein